MPKEERKAEDPQTHQEGVRYVHDRSEHLPHDRSGRCKFNAPSDASGLSRDSSRKLFVFPVADKDRASKATCVLSRRALRFIVLLVGFALVVVASVRQLSRRWLFPVHEVPSAATGAEVVAHTWLARDGTVVHAFELAAPPEARTIVYFHNNRETVEHTLTLASDLRARGFGVMLVEYRGYGTSRGGVPTERGLYLDAETALEVLHRRGIPASRIVLWGTSLGTGVAAEMARRGHGSMLVLVTPYTSIPDLVCDVVPLLPARLLVADHFDTLSKSEDIHVPTVVIHGDADEIVPFWMGETIARAIRGARLLRVVGGHHGDLFARDGERLLSEVARLGT